MVLIMDNTMIQQAASYIKEKIRITPKVCIILGSGLGDLTNQVEAPIEIPYSEIPHFPISTVVGHEGKMVFGKMQGKYVLLMAGRFHYYEGYSMQEVAFPIAVISQLDCKTLIVTNAAGGINTLLAPGDLMLITDHIKLCSDNPLRGANIPELGVRFTDMTYAYTPKLRELAIEISYGMGLTLHEGVYGYMSGPCYETPAEIHALEILGADAVGMSTVPEVIMATHCGMDVLGISCISNMAAGILDQKLSHQEVLEAGQAVKESFTALLNNIITRL